MSEPILVTVRCPRCALAWHQGTIVPGRWWAAGLTPARVAQVHCPRCAHPPPMIVVEPGP